MTGLGVFDLGGNGLASAHDVGIFTRAGVSVVQTTLARGLSGTYVAGTVDGSRFNTVSAALVAGQQYYVLADNFSTDNYVFGTGVVYPAITWTGFVDGSSNSISSSARFNGGVPGNLGPNFLFASAAAVPEPTSLSLVALALVGGVAARRASAGRAPKA